MLKGSAQGFECASASCPQEPSKVEGKQWRLVYLDIGEIVLADDFEVRVADINHNTASFSIEEADALGEMMAAAPEMFEALVQARDWLRGWASAEAQLAVIDAALLKATGGGNV